ncbi:PIN domain-containing protein [Luteolibacter sp. Populi]|uniref:PIN domain-containing protein n=1 Tax=Luteolibacter sp. Populi TaxID=3230487 RepID=UPI00346529E6
MKISFLLDSSACIPVLRNQVGLKEHLPDPTLTGIPVIVAAELWTGVKKNITTHPHHAGRLQTFLGLFAHAEFTMDVALHYADVRADLEAKGTPIGPLDLLIAAQALSLDATLVTSNAGEFRRVKGLKLLEWRKPSI